MIEEGEEYWLASIEGFGLPLYCLLHITSWLELSDGENEG